MPILLFFSLAHVPLFGNTVKILIEENVQELVLEAKGVFHLQNMETKKTLDRRYFGKKGLLKAEKGGIKWKENYRGISHIRLLPKQKTSSFLINGIQYKGTLEVKKGDKGLSIITITPIDEYLKVRLNALLSHNPLKKSALEALAIIERTYITASIKKSQEKPWDIEGKKGHYLGHSYTKLNPMIDEAVKQTHSKVLLYKSTPFLARWTPHSGGKTATSSTVFQTSSPSPQGVTSPHALKGRQESYWHFSLPQKTLAHRCKMNRVTAIELFVDPLSDKVYALNIKDGSHTQKIDFPFFQKLVGKKHLLSNDFSIHFDHETIQFEGYGKGVGVGLCLYSANEMAKEGATAEKILSHFFPNTRLTKEHYEKAKNL